jgi:hypothetical protein
MTGIHGEDSQHALSRYRRACHARCAQTFHTSPGPPSLSLDTSHGNTNTALTAHLSPAMAFFSDLPPELVNNIFALMSVTSSATICNAFTDPWQVRTKDDQKRVCLVSRAFRELTLND